MGLQAPPDVTTLRLAKAGEMVIDAIARAVQAADVPDAESGFQAVNLHLRRIGAGQMQPSMFGLMLSRCSHDVQSLFNADSGPEGAALAKSDAGGGSMTIGQLLTHIGISTEPVALRLGW